MSLKDCLITATVIFTDGNKRYFRGDRFEKEDKKLMVYNLRKMLLKFEMSKIKVIQMYDNEKMASEDRMILHYEQGVMLRNNLVNYLGADYNPKMLK